MDLSLTKQQQSLRDTYRDFCNRELAPGAARIDREAVFPADNLKKLAKEGFLGLLYPMELGGSGAGWEELVIAGEEVARTCASTFLTAWASFGLCGIPILEFGGPGQKGAFLPRLASAALVGASAVSEPAGGSYTKQLGTTVVRDDGGYILTGEKSFVTNGPVADLSVVFAGNGGGMAPEDPSRLSAFIVEKGAPGISPGESFETLGVRGAKVGGLSLVDCRVSEGSLLGREGEGRRIMEAVSAVDRIAMAVYSLGIAEACLGDSIRYAMERTVGGRPIAHHQEIHFRIADMKILTYSARRLLYKVAWMQDNGRDAATLSRAAKLFASEGATQCADWAVRIHGGYGYTSRHSVERYYRDAKLGEIAGGTSELARMAVADRILADDEA